MFGLSLSELVLILAIALVVLGPKRIPEVARELGRFVAMLRNTMDEFKRDVALPKIDLQQELRKVVTPMPEKTEPEKK